ncbi:hypothetical protein PUN28_003164 [Cardiocondyla obscurior]|uniref:Uncharacterized protein n=1 Tax=Cardiocondyla obscurior TaxID=286306 RepID=A0AAW2GN66_9HYME
MHVLPAARSRANVKKKGRGRSIEDRCAAPSAEYKRVGRYKVSGATFTMCFLHFHSIFFKCSAHRSSAFADLFVKVSFAAVKIVSERLDLDESRARTLFRNCSTFLSVCPISRLLRPIDGVPDNKIKCPNTRRNAQ